MIAPTHNQNLNPFRIRPPRSGAQRSGSDNENLAFLLTDIARLLTEQGANEFRVQAYRKAAKTISDLDGPVRAVFERDGIDGLIALPTIGTSIANLIEQFLRTGHIPLLDRLRGDDRAEKLFGTVPSLGPELSRRIHEQLEIETLPELFAAANDGRLEKVPGIGRKRTQAVRECLAERLRDRRRVVASEKTYPPVDHSVAVSEILDVDAEYRRLAAENKLIKIAPQRFNPGAVAWLPILHTERGDRHYTALFSNTARAHELNATRDWVVVYRDDSKAHQRWTVITSQFGKLRGSRIVRGREQECLEYWQQTKNVENGNTAD
jgi:hypothetical protein